MRLQGILYLEECSAPCMSVIHKFGHCDDVMMMENQTLY
jgi:hypothetical protein